MASFAEVVFPEDIAYGSLGGPEYSTSIVVLGSGFEQRNVNWAQGRGRWNVGYGIKTEAQMATLIAFFRARQGRAQGFLFTDPLDHSATGQPIGIGTGTQTDFPLVKIYTSGGETYERIISKPKAGTISIYKDDVLQESGVSVSLTTGLVIFTGAPALDAVITADFTFYVPVRFDRDYIPISVENRNLQDGFLVNAPDVEIVEIRV